MSAQRPPPPPSPPLALEEYAAVAARMLHDAGRMPDMVLAELGIPPASWHASAAAWERALDEELSRGDDRLLSVFASRFIATRAALGRAASARAAMAEPVNGPETMAVSHERVSLPAMPFRPSEPAHPVDDAARRALARVGLPFVQPSEGVDNESVDVDAPGSPPTLRSPRPAAIPEPPTSVSVQAGPTTLRLDVAWPPSERRPSRPSRELPAASTASGNPAGTQVQLERERERERVRADEYEAPAPIPLVRVKRRSARVSWLARILSWLRRDGA